MLEIELKNEELPFFNNKYNKYFRDVIITLKIYFTANFNIQKFITQF